MRHLLRACVPAVVALLVLVDGVPAQGRGQGRGRGPGGQGPALLRDTLPGRGPIGLLLARRDSLGLTAPQVKQLQQLDSVLQQQNSALVRDMLELRREVQPRLHPRDMTPAQREQFAQQAARARPIMQRVQENNRRAMERVSELLTPEQKRRLREWLQSGRGMARGMGRGMGMGGPEF
jgi:Spy/CpxP family protein refolding chaperone